MKTKIIIPVILALLLLCRMQASAQSNTYTGQELFAGLFFGVGPVAALVPELYQEATTTNLPAIDKTLYVSNLTAQAAILSSNGYPADAGKLLRYAQRVSNAPTNLSLIPQHVLDSTVRSNLMNEIAAADPTFFGRFATNVQSGNAVLVSAAVTEGAERLWTLVDTMPDAEYFAGIFLAADKIDELVGKAKAYIIAANNKKHKGFTELAARPVQAVGYQFDDSVSLLTARLNANGPQPIPTVSEWGMIFLIIAILACGIYAINKRQPKRTN